MRVRVLWFGRPGASPYERQVEEYRSRVQRRWQAEDMPLRPATGGREADPGRVLRAEQATLQRQLPEGWMVVALDEGGRRLDSERFARVLDDAEQTATPGVAFVIGSDLGLAAELRRQVDLELSLGPMTLPHLLARLVLWEQIFRATHILGGGGYHRVRVQ